MGSQHLMALRAAHSAVKMGSLRFCGWVIVVWDYPAEGTVQQDRCWWPADAGEL